MLDLRSKSRDKHKPVDIYERKVLIVEDDRSQSLVLQMLLFQDFCQGVCVEQAYDAAYEVLNNSFDLVILDWKMPEMGGEKFLMVADTLLDATHRVLNSEIPVIIYSGLEAKNIDIPFMNHFSVKAIVSKITGISELNNMILKELSVS